MLIGRLNAVRTSWIADSIGDMGREGELAGMWPGTRSEQVNLPAIRRERTLLLTCCDTNAASPRSPSKSESYKEGPRQAKRIISGSSLSPMRGLTLAPRLSFLCPLAHAGGLFSVRHLGFLAAAGRCRTLGNLFLRR